MTDRLLPPPEQLLPLARALVGPDAADYGEDRDNALRYAGGTDGTRPGKYGFQGAEVTPEHFCQLDGDAYEWCSRIPAGGLAYCLVCGIPIFIPPQTCLERIDHEPAAEIVVDRASGRRTIR